VPFDVLAPGELEGIARANPAARRLAKRIISVGGHNRAGTVRQRYRRAQGLGQEGIHRTARRALPHFVNPIPGEVIRRGVVPLSCWSILSFT
jgi:hypothetical protein